MSPLIRRLRALLVACLATAGHARVARAQVADSIPAWTAALQRGTLEQRNDAVASLLVIGGGALPSATQQAVVAELRRIHAGEAPGASIDPDLDSGELAADYYTALVSLASQFRTRDAAIALAPAVSMSAGVARRVARLGDTAVVLMTPMLHRAYEAGSALETLGFAWFWADSANGPLSARSRSRIVDAFVSAAESDSTGQIIGMERALARVADPVFLPLAIALRDRALTMGDGGAGTARALDASIIPMLTSASDSRTVVALAQGLDRALSAICGLDPLGRRNGACQSMSNDMLRAQRFIRAGQFDQARTALETLSRHANEARSAGALRMMETVIVTGGSNSLSARLGLGR